MISDVMLECLVINSLATQIDRQTKTITLGHNVNFIMVNVKKIKLELPNKLPAIQFPFSHSQFLAYCKSNKLIELITTQMPSLSLNSRECILAPLLVTRGKMIIGCLVWFLDDRKQNKKDDFLDSQNYLSSITIGKCNPKIKLDKIKLDKIKEQNIEVFNPLLGILALETNLKKITAEMQKYIMNSHAYLPNFQVIRKAKPLAITNSFQNRLNP